MIKTITQLRIGLAIISTLILLSIICLHYEIIASETVIYVMLIPCFVYAGSMLLESFKKGKKIKD